MDIRHLSIQSPDCIRPLGQKPIGWIRSVSFIPPPLPPQNPDQVRNFFVSINEPGKLTIPLPYRAAPQIRGRIWNDQNGDGLEAPEEKGTSAATLFSGYQWQFSMRMRYPPAEDGKFLKLHPRPVLRMYSAR